MPWESSSSERSRRRARCTRCSRSATSAVGAAGDGRALSPSTNSRPWRPRRHRNGSSACPRGRRRRPWCCPRWPRAYHVGKDSTMLPSTSITSTVSLPLSSPVASSWSSSSTRRSRPRPASRPSRRCGARSSPRGREHRERTRGHPSSARGRSGRSPGWRWGVGGEVGRLSVSPRPLPPARRSGRRPRRRRGCSATAMRRLRRTVMALPFTLSKSAAPVEVADALVELAAISDSEGSVGRWGAVVHRSSPWRGFRSSGTRSRSAARARLHRLFTGRPRRRARRPSRPRSAVRSSGG